MPHQDKHRSGLFISYSRRNKAQVYPFAKALANMGIRIWLDREEIEPLDDFPARIRDGLASSQALLAWYSPEYAQSKYCQKELTAAWICAQRLTRNVLSRILIVNPEESVAHIALGDVGRQNYLAAPKDEASQAVCIQSIHDLLAGLSEDFGAVREFKPPEWHPSAQQGSARFVGRLRELWRIHTALNPVGISEHENPHIVVQLRGLGGVGKSLLAIEYANRFGASYPGGIHWLRAHGFDLNKPMKSDAREGERRGQIENLALRHDVAIRDKNFREISRDLGRRLAASGPYLWIVDDLPPGLGQERGLPGWCAPSANGCTLVTTRCRDYEGVVIEVDLLDPEPALELLTQERKPLTDQELRDAKGLAEDLGRHALALDVAGHFLLKTKSFAVLRAEVTGEDAEAKSDPLGKLAAGLSGQLPGGHEKSIVATLVKSVRLLGEQGLSLLRLACELHGGTPIPLRLAKAVFKRAFTLEDEAAEDYRALAVNQLEMHSLATVSFGGAGSDDVLSFHSLVRYTMLHGDPARSKALALRETLREAAVKALFDLLQDVVDIRKHASLEMDLAHARHLVPQLGTTYEALLSTRLARYESERGNYREALAMAKRALLVQERVAGPEHPDTLATRQNIAALTGEKGEAGEALRLFRELLRDQERVLGPNHPDTLSIRHDIVFWTGETGEAREALRLFRELLPDQERVLGPDHRHTLGTRYNIASSTGQTGEAHQALRLFRELLPDQERVLGPDHPDTLATRNSIASSTGDNREALRLLRELLPDQERVLGSEHPDTLVTRYNIASSTGQTGEAREALRLFRELLPDQERVLGPNHPNTLATRNNIASSTGDNREALRLFRELLPDRERVVGPDHPDTLATRRDIASSTGDTGETREALRLFRELLLDQERVLGPDHPDTLATLNDIAGWTGQTGEAREALRLFRELLPNQERVLGPDHPDTLRTRNNLAGWTGLTGEAREALRLFRELLPDQERTLGSDHPDTLATRNNIASSTGDTGEAREALRLFRELLPDQVRVLGPDHPNTLAIRHNIAGWTGQTGEAREALRLFRELLPDRERVLGPDHPNTLGSRNNIAFWTGQTGEAREALRLFRELLPDQERTLGPDHPDTLTTRNNIAFWKREGVNARSKAKTKRRV